MCETGDQEEDGMDNEANVAMIYSSPADWPNFLRRELLHYMFKKLSFIYQTWGKAFDKVPVKNNYLRVQKL